MGFNLQDTTQLQPRRQRQQQARPPQPQRHLPENPPHERRPSQTERHLHQRPAGGVLTPTPKPAPGTGDPQPTTPKDNATIVLTPRE